MKRFLSSIFLLCGLSLSLAAFSAFGQEASNGLEINKKPLKDFAASVKAKNIDWTKSFLVETETVLTKDGKFDNEKTKVTKTEGDAATVEAVMQAFEAIGESGWFGYLRSQGIENIKLSASQNAEVFAVSVISEQTTRERAATLTRGMNMLVKTLLMFDKNGTKKLGDDEKKLLSGTKVTAEEKNVTINISLAAADFQEMVKRGLNGEKETTAK